MPEKQNVKSNNTLTHENTFSFKLAKKVRVPCKQRRSINDQFLGASLLAMPFSGFPPATFALLSVCIVTGAYFVYDCIKISIRNDNLKEVEKIIQTKSDDKQKNQKYNRRHEWDLFEEIVKNYTGNWLSSSSSSRELIKVLRGGKNITLEHKRKALDTYIQDKKNHPKRLFTDIIKTLKIEKDNSSTKERSFKVILPKTTDLGFS